MAQLMNQEEYNEIADKVLEETCDAYLETAKKYIEAHAGKDNEKFNAITSGVAHGLILAGSTILGQEFDLDFDWTYKHYQKFTKKFVDEYKRREEQGGN